MSFYSNSTDGNGQRPRGQRAPWHPVEFVAMALGFLWYWPIGLAILGLKMWQRKSGETGDLATAARSAYSCGGQWAQNAARTWGAARPGWPQGNGAGFASGMGRTGNSAFDDWRAAEVAKLEQERQRLADAEREFADHISSLRRARDREEFDRFMAARNGGDRTGPAA